MKQPTIGIVGFGDLGSKLAAWLSDAGMDIVVFDPHKTTTHNQVDSLQDLVRKSDIMHWCTALEALDELEEIEPSQCLVLHASVMALSVSAKQKIRNRGVVKGSIEVVHFLMNKHNTVVISRDSDAVDLIKDHIESIGHHPRVLDTKEHDRIMALSQAPMALLHELVLYELLVSQRNLLLTPSGEELLAAIQKRAAKWTPTTLSSILRNPEIKRLLQRMSELTQSNSKD